MSNLTLSESAPFDLEIDYWKDKLSGVKPLNLFTDYERSKIQSRNNKASVEFLINEKLNKQLRQFSDRRKVTLFVTLLSVYKVLLYRYSGQEDICVGNTILKSGDNKKN